MKQVLMKLKNIKNLAYFYSTPIKKSDGRQLVKLGIGIFLNRIDSLERSVIISGGLNPDKYK